MPHGVAGQLATADSQKTGHRVFLHVGAPKTGTTYLQNVLWHNRSALADGGVLYPLSWHFEHFHATMDVRRMPWAGKHNPNWEGAWDRVASRVRDWSGSVSVISNEILGGATTEQVRDAVESLRPAEVEVVFTARDLARQLPADWQEHLKHRHRVTFEKFVDDLVELGPDAPKPFGEMFWGLHDPVEVLARWAHVVPADRIHVVTVPQSGAPRDLLWRRFAQVLGIDADRYDMDIERANPSIGVAEAELLRRVNEAIRGRIAQRHADSLMRVLMGEDILAKASAESPRLRLPARRMAWANERSRELIDRLHAAKYQVVGDLEELMPAPVEKDAAQPESVPAEQLLAPAITTIGQLLTQLARERDVKEEALAKAKSQPPPAPDHPIREWVGRRYPRAAGHARRVLDFGRRAAEQGRRLTVRMRSRRR